MTGRIVALAVTAVLAATAPAPAASWSPQVPAIPRGAVASPLRSVSCPAARVCIAVGTSGPTFDPGIALVERWDRSSWVIEPVPQPRGASFAQLTDVSCHSTVSCLAVGTAGTPTAGVGSFAERWDGRRWTLLTPPSPPGALASILKAVACPRSHECVAAGVAYFPGPSRYSVPHALIERWDGLAWTIEPTSDLGASDLSLDDVSCSAPDACTAVGYADRPGTGQVPLVERWDGHAWTLQDTPAIAGRVYSQLSGVSCPRRRFCEAVGYVSTSAEIRGIAERWDGAAWRLEPTPGPLSGPSQLLGITCGPRGRCSAVGEVNQSPTGNELPLAERRTPAGWTVEPTPLPAGGVFGRLWGVSCSDGGGCTAVGWWGTASPGLRPLAERRSR